MFGDRGPALRFENKFPNFLMAVGGFDKPLFVPQQLAVAYQRILCSIKE